METQPPNSSKSIGETLPAGTAVIYGLLGRCTITSIENRAVAGESMDFYKLEVQKPAASRSSRQDPAIWVPIRTARDRGLRLPMSATDVENAYRVISNREYYFATNESWSTVHTKLEASVRAEGGVGLAKALSYLFVLKRKQVVPAPEVARMYEQVLKQFIREVSESTGKAPKAIDEELTKMLRHKLLPDN